MPYEETITAKQAKEYLKALSHLGEKESKKKKSVLITSAPCEEENSLRVLAYDAENKRFWQTKSPKIPSAYPGTGDSFASVFLGALLQKDSLPMAMARAARFIYDVMLMTYGYGTPYIDGIMLEKALPGLSRKDIFLFEDF
jgi:pyridoxine kinase